MNLPEPQSVTFSSLISQIEHGSIKIPQFQRDFVWTRLQSARLIDSIIKGYPIGTFILWRTQERLRAIRNIGGINLPTPGMGEHISYVLDGQQRMTSLFVSLKSLQVELGDGVRDYGQMYIDLLGSEDQELVVLEDLEPGSHRYILLGRLLEGDFQYLASFPPAQQERLKRYSKNIESYQFSVIQVRDAPIEIATDIFTRLNIGGKSLSVFEIMVAKTYDHDRKFDLLERVTAIENLLIDRDFGELPHATILQAAAACLASDVSAKAILRLSRDSFITNWPRIQDALLTAVDYLRNSYSIPVERLLPFPVLVAAFTYFFYRSELTQPTAEQRGWLKDFFWRVSLTGRYSQSMESHLTSDLKKIDHFVAGENAEYDWPLDTSARFIEQNGYFNAQRSFIKGLLCLLASQAPKSFNTGHPVRLRNDWLQRANSKNYHHFFPRAYMRNKTDKRESVVNHIANITFVDDYLNKRVIRANPPSVYLARFQQENPDLAVALGTHFIDLNQDRVLLDDFDTFFQHRLSAFSTALQKQVIAQEIDRKSAALPDEENGAPDDNDDE